MKRIFLILVFLGICDFAYVPGIVYPSATINNAIINNMQVGLCSCPSTITVNHNTSDGVSPFTVDITYGVVATSITGDCKCWITRNLGATAQASSATDTTDASAGWYWQFDHKQGYGNSSVYPTWTITPSWPSSSFGNNDWTAAQDPCTLLLGAGWRLPTKAEWQNADGPPQNWGNRNDTYASVLKLHATGYLNRSNGALNNRGSRGDYWSSTQTGATGWGLHFNSGSHMLANDKAFGFSARCLRD